MLESLILGLLGAAGGVAGGYALARAGRCLALDHDLECGRAAGVKTAAALWGPFDRSHLADLEPDYWLERPEDILALAPDT